MAFAYPELNKKMLVIKMHVSYHFSIQCLIDELRITGAFSCNMRALLECQGQEVCACTILNKQYYQLFI